jgi:hypothetical protein
MRWNYFESMKKAIILFLLFIFCGEKTSLKITSLSLLPENELLVTYSKIGNLDSLVCSIIEENNNLEILYSCFELFSMEQQDAIMACVKYSDKKLGLVDNPKKKIPKGKVRLTFEIFNNYFGRNKGNDLAIKVVLEECDYKTKKVIYLLRNIGDNYYISDIIGELQ